MEKLRIRITLLLGSGLAALALPACADSGGARGEAYDASTPRPDVIVPPDVFVQDTATADRAPPTDPPPPLDAGGGETGSPNIVFVLVDDLAWNLVQYMPNVVEMKKHGMTFANYFVTDSLCCPSRTSIFTGRFPHSSGVFTNDVQSGGGYSGYLSHGNDAKTFAVALHDAGYRTSMMGKFLNGYDPNHNDAAMGWDDWNVAGDGYAEVDYDLNQNGAVHRFGSTPQEFLVDVMAGLGTDFITSTPDKPLLIELATFAPHGPYAFADRHKGLYPNVVAPRDASFGARPKPSDPAWLRAIPALTAAQEKQIDTAFHKRVLSVQSVDEMIGKLQATLAATGRDKDTYIFFSSDNGFHMGEHSLTPGKQTAFDTDIRVPLIVTGPGIPAGVVVDQVAQNVDLCPTFTELAHAKAPPTANGHSLVSLLHGESPSDWRNAALVEHRGPKVGPNDPDFDGHSVYMPTTYEALRLAQATYVEYTNGDVEYHDLATDPLELTNSASSLSPARKQALHDALAAMKTCQTEPACWAAQHVAP